MTREAKTPLQRAEDALALAQRQLERKRKKLAAAEVIVDEVRAEVSDARRRLAYAAADPALPDAPPLFDDAADDDREVVGS